MYDWTRRLSNSTMQIFTAVTLNQVAQSTAEVEQTSRTGCQSDPQEKMNYFTKENGN